MSPVKDKNRTIPLKDLGEVEEEIKKEYPGISKDQMIVELFRSISNQIAINNQLVINFIEEQKTYRAEREKRDQERQLTTAERIEVAIRKEKTGLWEFIRDRIIPALVIAIVLKIWGLF